MILYPATYTVATCIIAGGDFFYAMGPYRYFNLSRSNTNLNFALHHDTCQVDYSYSFKMIRLSVPDYFLLSYIIFKESLSSVSALDDIDNLLYHEPIVLHLRLNIQCIGFQPVSGKSSYASCFMG